MAKNENEAINLTCKDCGREFFFSGKEQKFYGEQGFQQPKRCFDCRKAKKARKEQEAPAGEVSDRELIGA